MSLTRREREVVELLGRGEPVKCVAEMLGLSVSAVEARAGRAYKKLGARNCRDALRMLKRQISLHRQEPPAARSLWGDETA